MSNDDWVFPSLQPIRDPAFLFWLRPGSKGPLFRLRSPWKFTVNFDGFNQEYVIPVGYEFDKASIPPQFWSLGLLPDGLCTVPAMVHDFLCDLYNGGSEWLRVAVGGVLPPAPPASIIHRNFYNMLQAEGVHPLRCKVMYAAVLLFGPGGLLRPSVIWSKM